MACDTRKGHTDKLTAAVPVEFVVALANDFTPSLHKMPATTKCMFSSAFFSFVDSREREEGSEKERERYIHV